MSLDPDTVRLIRCTPFVLLLMLGIGGPVHAASLSFDEALDIAVRETPALTAQITQIEAARSAAIPADALPDPRLSFGVENLPLEGPDRYSVSNDFMTMRRVGLMQEFPNGDKRQARGAAAQGRLAVAEAEAGLVRLTVLRETALAWIARDTVERQRARIGALAEENRLFDAVVRARHASGQEEAIALIAPREEAALIEQRGEELDAQHAQAIAALRRWIGMRADDPLAGAPPDWPIGAGLLRDNLHRHPELAAFEPKAHVLDAEIAEARAMKKPDWSLEVAYQRRDPEFGDMASVMVGLDLPLFAARRQDPDIAARHAERTALDAEREATRREHAAMLEADLVEHERLTKAVARQQGTLLPLAQEKMTLALAAWRGGKGDLAEVIAARRERIERELEAIALDGERRATAAKLHYTYGETP